MARLYADDMLVDEVPDEAPDEMFFSQSVDCAELWPNTRKYQSSISSTEYPPWKQLLRRTNCRNCAAPLPKDGKCIYCGTNNDREEPEENSNVRSEMKITPSSITFTCEPVRQSYQYESAATRDVYGRLHRGGD